MQVVRSYRGSRLGRPLAGRHQKASAATADETTSADSAGEAHAAELTSGGGYGSDEDGDEEATVDGREFSPSVESWMFPPASHLAIER